MSEFIINIQNSAGTNRGSVTPDVGFNYTDNLNDVNEATMTFSSLSSNDRSLLALGNLVEIQRDGTVEFFGFIDSISNTVGGGMQVHASGHEIWLAKENGSYSNSPWNDEATEDIFDDLIGDSSYVVLGTTDNAFDFDFRANQSQSIMENIKNLLAKTGQDMEIDYTTLNYGTATTYGITMNITDAKGSTTSVATFSQGINIRNLLSKQSYPRANKILVYGKGDGENQITGSDSDATSISTYGEITKTIVDRTVMTTREANKLAEKTLPLYKDPQKYFFFDMVDPNVDLESGDVATLQSPEHDLSDESVRIVGIDRGQTLGQEFLKLEVSDTVSNKRLQKRNRFMAELEEQSRENNSYKQGSTNVTSWGSGINANNAASLKIGFYVSPTIMQDEAGDLRITSMTLDYDVDRYNKQVGAATFDGSDPQVQNTSGDDDADVTGTSDNSAVDTEFDSNYKFVAGGGNSTLTVGLGNVSGDTDFSIITFYLSLEAVITMSSSGYDIEIENLDTSTTYESISGVCSDNSTYVGSLIVSGDIEGDDIRISITDNTGGAYPYTFGISIAQIAEHDHGDGSYAADDHSHPNGGYDIDAADLDEISIGDSISESTDPINATSTDIYLDYWNGLTWVNKHSILATGNTIDNDVDITDGGTYPDATGHWRVRILTNDASPDYVQGIVKIKYHLDS